MERTKKVSQIIGTLHALQSKHDGVRQDNLHIRVNNQESDIKLFKVIASKVVVNALFI